MSSISLVLDLLIHWTGVFSQVNPAKDVLKYNIADEVQKVLAEDT